jgi:hypothetical protein
MIAKRKEDRECALIAEIIRIQRQVGLPMTDHICPSCGQTLPLKQDLVTGRERRRLVELLSQRPHGMTRDEIARLLYADDPNGGPENTLAVCQLVHQARLQLMRQGWTIHSNRGPGAHYRLVRLP